MIGKCKLKIESTLCFSIKIGLTNQCVLNERFLIINFSRVDSSVIGLVLLCYITESVCDDVFELIKGMLDKSRSHSQRKYCKLVLAGCELWAE